MTEKLELLTEKLRVFLNGRAAMIVYLLVAALTVSFSIEQYVIPLFILWLLFVLIVEKNFLSIFFPMLLLNAFALRTAGQATILTKHIWLIIPVIAAIVLHFVLHYKSFTRGKMLFAQIGVSIALLLGGLFSISPEEYFSPDALYYVMLLGPGMVFFYLWFRNSVSFQGGYDCKGRLMESFYGLGIFCAYSILDQTVRSLIALGIPVTAFVWANDICVLMVFAIPAAAYFARENYLHIFSAFAFFGTLILTDSRAGAIVGGVMLLLSLLYLARYRKELRALSIALAGAVFVGALFVFILLCVRHGGFAALFATEENGRMALVSLAWQRFLQSPIFGAGLGEVGDAEVSFMAIPWTHNYIMQVVGSLGLFGIAAYGYQIYVRTRLVLARIDPFTVAAALSYLSLFLISMLQPGEFCPMPYATMAVMIFTVLEISQKETKKVEKNKPSS